VRHFPCQNQCLPDRHPALEPLSSAEGRYRPPREEFTMRIALGILIALHGIAHVVGFVMPWQLMTPEAGGYSTTILNGRIDLGSGGIRMLGLIWLALAVGFVLAALGSWLGFGGWVRAAAVLAIVSLALSVLGWPEAKIGVPVNLAILGALYMGTRLDWL
jgi:hypothetical protein